MHHRSITNQTHYEGLPIDTWNGQFFCFLIILHSIREMMLWMLTKHCRVLPIRFDLHFPLDYRQKGDNAEITHFFKMMRDNARSLSRRKGVNIDLQYVWAREQKGSTNPHYHCIVFLNGSVVRDYRRFLGEVRRVWEHVLERDTTNLVWPCDRDRFGKTVENGVMLESPNRNLRGDALIQHNRMYNAAIERLFYRASYLAKTNQKQDTPPDKHRFNSSQLN